MKTFPWLRMQRKTDIELPLEPPIWLGSRSNGEYFHEQTPRERAMRKMILQRADEGARRLGVDRRMFLASSAGMATTLAVFNFFGCGSSANPRGASGQPQSGGGSSGGSGAGEGSSGSGSGSGGAPSGSGGGSSGGTEGSDAGGYYDTGTDLLDAAQHCEVGLDPSKEFIFDIQTHHFSDRVASGPYGTFISILPQAMCGLSPVQACFERNEYIRQMFLNSDTTVSVLSGIPATDIGKTAGSSPECLPIGTIFVVGFLEDPESQ